MSKEDRSAYHVRRRAHEQAVQAVVPAVPQPKTKAERRALQDAQKKVIEDKKDKKGEREQLLYDLKLQGLSEEAAKEVILEMEKDLVVAEEEDDEDDAEDDLLSSVKRWLAEQDQTITKDALSDFNMKVRFQGHVDTTPPDHVRALLHLLCAQACQDCDLAAAKVLPATVAQRVAPTMARWSPLLCPMFKRIDDIMIAADTVVEAVQSGLASLSGVPEAGQACGLIGCFMAIREIDMIDDEDLLTGCRRLEPRSHVLDKFVKFLEELDDDDDDDESD